MGRVYVLGRATSGGLDDEAVDPAACPVGYMVLERVGVRTRPSVHRA